jgi:thioredoxin-related protein
MQYLATLILLVFSCSAWSESPDADWSDVAQTARDRHQPILVVFSADTCGYCSRLKREVLDPMSQQEAADSQPLIREFDINTGGKLTDFNGERIRSRQFKQRYGIFATPTLLILDPDGHPLSDPLVGYNSPDEYRELLQNHLVTSYRALK